MPPKVATRSSLEQIARLDLLLRRKYGASMLEMCDALECCEKTVRRHVQWMELKLGCRITRPSIDGRDTWKYQGESDAIFNRNVTRWMP